MPQISVARLFDDNRAELGLAWVQGDRETCPMLDSSLIQNSSKGLTGHLNFIHPSWIQIFSHTEASYLQSLGEDARRKVLEDVAASGMACLILSDGEHPPEVLASLSGSLNVPMLSTSLPSLQVIWVLRTYLGRVLAEFVTRHGVLLDVLGMGVLLTGDSGVGKSELALELITRGSGLVADDVVDLYHIAPQTLEGRCPEMLKDFLEVRGLGILNIRTIFGETAVRTRKNLKLLVQLERPVGGNIPGLERLPLNASTEDIMGVSIRKVQLPVAAGRNLAVLVEAAVRNYVLQLRGIDSTQDFILRQEKQLGNKENR